MALVKLCFFALLKLAWVITGAAQYDTCSGDQTWVGDGDCDASTNTPECEYDGGDCCSCTCLDGPIYTCGDNGYDCKDATCIDPDLQTEYPYCDGNLLLWNDGECDAEINNEICGYDGGDCCLCTCVSNGQCRFSSFDCVDPSAEEPLHQCQPSQASAANCSVDAKQTWIVENTAQARSLAEEVKCSGGTFDVLWKGFVTVDTTITVANGTVLNITGVQGPSPAVISGGLDAQLLTVVNASLHLSDVGLSSGSSVVGGAITVSASNVTLTRTHFSGNKAKGMGGALYVTECSYVVFDGNATSFINNAAVGCGGAMYASRSCTIRFSGEQYDFLHNVAGEPGGAIAIEQSELWLIGRVRFDNNTGGYTGGAINVADGSSASWNGSIFFTRNTAEFGGALAVYMNSSVSWSGKTSFEFNQALSGGGAILMNEANVSWIGNTEFISNAASDGGAIYASSAAELSWSGVCLFLNNTSEQGGAVVIFSGSFVQWEGANTTFALNTASLGGAIASLESNVSSKGHTRFEHNRAHITGGAMHISDGSVSWSEDTSFVSNQADISGGALYLAGAHVSWDGNTVFASNMATNILSTGGAPFAGWAAHISWSGFTSFVNNSAAGGGAMHVSTGSSISWKGYTVFERNRAHFFGGAMYIFDSDVSWSEDTSFVSNQANASGGALDINSAHVSWDGNTMFASNRATAIAGGGGALSSSLAANISWSGFTSFSNNSAWSGGALSVSTGSSISWSGPKTVFESNTATFSSGGAIHAWGSIISWTGGTVFRNNRANLSGGAMHVFNYNYLPINVTSAVASNTENLFLASVGALQWSGTTLFINNSAVSGGAITAMGVNVSWSGLNTTFAFNTATRAGGGAIRVQDSSLLWSGVTYFRNNIATSSFGGGIFVWSKGQIEWKGDTTFTGNNALFGGAIHIYQEVWVKWTGRTTFVSNKANIGGGAIDSFAFDASAGDNLMSFLFIYGTTTFVDNICYLDGGAISMTGGVLVEFDPAVNVTFWGNSAGAAGGAVFMSGANVGPSFGRVRFMFNSAQLGGGVYATSSGNARIDWNGRETKNPTTFDQCSFIGNTAFATGGAIQSAAGEDSILHTLFLGNTAKVGGALYLAGTSSFYNCSFVDNIANEDSGPVIWNIGYIASIQGSSFAGNTYNCAPGTFLAYIKSDNLYEGLCASCDVPCELCSFENSSSVPYCEVALAHSSSNGSSTTIQSLLIDPGYWRATATSENVLACYHPDACEGGVTGAPNYCRKGYQGPYCATCSDGYTEGPGFTCDKCSSSDAGIALIVVVSVVAVFSIICLGRYLTSGELEQTRRAFVQRLMRYIPLQTIKIVIVAWQILTQFASVANVTYPSVYQRFLDGVTVVNFDLSWVLSVGCVLDLDFHGRLLLATLGPIVAVVMLGVTFCVATLQNRGSDRALENIRYKHVSAVLLLTFFVYSSVSSMIFQTFSCDPLDDGSIYLRADYRVQCDSPKHGAFQTYAGFMIVLYAFGIPALYAILLFKDRDLLANKRGGSNIKSARDSNHRARSTSNLWKSYKPKRFYYEVIECTRRILLTGILVFIYPNTAAQIAVSLIISFTFTVASEALNPYSSTWDTWVSRMGHVVVFVSVYLALLLKVDVSDERSESQTVFEAILVFVHVCMILAVLGEALILACSLRAERQEDPSPRFRGIKGIHNTRVASLNETAHVSESKASSC